MTMTEQNTDDKQLHAYLRGQSSLSELYQQVTAAEPGKQVDAAILSAARAAVKSRPRRTHWFLPAAIAAVLLIGVALVWWRQVQPPAQLNTTQSAAPTAQQTLPQQIDQSLHNNPAADQWLEHILKLHNAGKTAQAAAQFKKFRETYPLYSLDPQRFGKLQQYDK
jgi:hypothetical protein